MRMARDLLCAARQWAAVAPYRATLANNPIKQSVHPVTHLACASCAPVWPAAYRVRWTDSERY